VSDESIIITLANCTATLLEEIAAKECKRRDVAKTYALAMRTEKAGVEKVDWKAVNAAIIARWSVSGLNWIKTQAWSGKCWR
jgi:hypothetical protein